MKLGMRTLKTAFGATLAIFIAEFLKLDYAVSAGVITVLSIQNTKKKLTLASDSACLFNCVSAVHFCRIILDFLATMPLALAYTYFFSFRLLYD
nr:aromatic acid exporter family protein [Listeria aquatica]